jgi:hypothetical protein
MCEHWWINDWQDKTEILSKDPALVLPCPPKIQHELSWDEAGTEYESQ